MLVDPRARTALSGFLRQWLTVDGFHADQHPRDLQAALDEELQRDLDEAMAAPDGVSALLTSPRTWVNSVLETFYGLPARSTGPTDWRAVDLDPEQRVGLLTHPLAHGQAGTRSGGVAHLAREIRAPDGDVRRDAAAAAQRAGAAGHAVRARRLRARAIAGAPAERDLRRLPPLDGSDRLRLLRLRRRRRTSSRRQTGSPSTWRATSSRKPPSSTATSRVCARWGRSWRPAPRCRPASPRSGCATRLAREGVADACTIESLTDMYRQNGRSLRALFRRLAHLDGFASRRALSEGKQSRRSRDGLSSAGQRAPRWRCRCWSPRWVGAPPPPPGRRRCAWWCTPAGGDAAQALDLSDAGRRRSPAQ